MLTCVLSNSNRIESNRIAVSTESNGNHGNVDVFAVVVFARDDDIKVSTLGRDFQFRDGLHQLAHFLIQALLVLWENVVVHQTRADGHGVGDQTLRLKVVQHILHRQIALQDPSVPHTPL